MIPKLDKRKSTKNEAMGVPKSTQNGQKIDKKCLEIAKISRKVQFSRYCFFDDFLNPKNDEKGVPGDWITAASLAPWEPPSPNPSPGPCGLACNFNRAAARFPSSPFPL